MPNVHVDYAAVQSTASQLTAGHQELESQLIRLKGLIENLVGSGFITDLASGKFRQSYEQWDHGMKNAITGLTDMGGYLNTVVSQHQQLDTALSHGAGG